MLPTIDELMTTLGFPTRVELNADQLWARIEEHTRARLTPATRSFLQRSVLGDDTLQIHAAPDDRGESDADRLLTWNAELIADWSWGACAFPNEPYLSRMVLFGDDEGDFVFLLDPANQLGFGPEAVYVCEKGALSLRSLRWVAPDLITLLSHYVQQTRPAIQDVLALRDAETARTRPPLRLGNGVVLEGVDDPRFFPGADVLRSVRLVGPVIVGGVEFVPMPGRRDWHTNHDLVFFADGRVESGYVAGGVVEQIPMAPGSAIHWLPNGELALFTPASTALVDGVPCRGGIQVARNRQSNYFSFTPDVDFEYRGYCCRGGAKVDAYGPGLGLHFTTARPFQISGRAWVPAGVAVTIMSDGGARFDLVAETVIDGKSLPAGTAVWYTGEGVVREIYRRTP